MGSSLGTSWNAANLIMGMAFTKSSRSSLLLISVGQTPSRSHMGRVGSRHARQWCRWKEFQVNKKYISWSEQRTWAGLSKKGGGVGISELFVVGMVRDSTDLTTNSTFSSHLL